jgi:hypothetical protein
LWFVAQTKLAWAQMYTRDPALAHQLEVEVLPALSTANVRELLKAVLTALAAAHTRRGYGPCHHTPDQPCSFDQQPAEVPSETT